MRHHWFDCPGPVDRREAVLPELLRPFRRLQLHQPQRVSLRSRRRRPPRQEPRGPGPQTPRPHRAAEEEEDVGEGTDRGADGRLPEQRAEDGLQQFTPQRCCSGLHRNPPVLLLQSSVLHLSPETPQFGGRRLHQVVLLLPYSEVCCGETKDTWVHTCLASYKSAVWLWRRSVSRRLPTARLRRDTLPSAEGGGRRVFSRDLVRPTGCSRVSAAPQREGRLWQRGRRGGGWRGDGGGMLLGLRSTVNIYISTVEGCILYL